MKAIDAQECKVHVLICTNEKPPGKACCKLVGGQEFYLKMKEKIKAEGLYNTHWATRTGCLGFCNMVGTTVTIHRPGQAPQWFSEVVPEDFDTIWAEVTRA